MKGGSFFGLGKSAAPKVKSEEEQVKDFARMRFSNPEYANATGEETGNRGERDLVQGLMGKTGTMEQRYEALKTEWAGMKRGNHFQMSNINPFSAGGKRYRKSRKSRKTKGGKKSKKSKKSKKTRKTRRKSRKH